MRACVGERVVTSIHLTAEAGRLCSGLGHGVYYSVGGSTDACYL